MPPRKLTLLIVDDEHASMRALCDTLEYEGYRTYGYTSAADALAAMRERSFDLLLADLQMPGTNGIDLMKSAQLIDPTLVAVIMTGHGALETAVAAMKAGALDYIQKPIKLATALPVLERALAVRQLRIEKKRLEENVRERTEQLKIANRELEAFSYSVSHDLRAPLRAVSTFTQALLSEHVDTLNEEGQRLLQNVNAGAAHMDRLITDLLRLSQLNRQELHRQPVRFGELVSRVIEDMAGERAGRDIEFVIADFPTWQVDPGLMQQVFVNLISNAIKFTRERAQARIEIGYPHEWHDAGVLRQGQRRGLQHQVHEQAVRRVPAPAFGRPVRGHRRRDCRSCAGSSNGTGARCGSTARRTRERRSTSACPTPEVSRAGGDSRAQQSVQRLHGRSGAVTAAIHHDEQAAVLLRREPGDGEPSQVRAVVNEAAGAQRFQGVFHRPAQRVTGGHRRVQSRE